MRALAIGLLAAACGASSPCGPSSATVDRVVDGDTIVLVGGTKIRYLLINAPETTLGHHDCFGAEAAAFNASLLQGAQVELDYDVQCDDKYGRTLAFVRAGTVDVNRALVSQGYACADFIPPDGSARAREFEDAESVAKTARRGMWGACSTVSCE